MPDDPVSWSWMIRHIVWHRMVLCHAWCWMIRCVAWHRTILCHGELEGQWCPSSVQHLMGHAHPGGALLSHRAPGETRLALRRLVSPSGPYLTAVVRTGNPAWSLPGSVFRPDPVGPILAWNPPALLAHAYWTLPDNYCSQGWECSLVFTRVGFQACPGVTGFGTEPASTVPARTHGTLPDSYSQG